MSSGSGVVFIAFIYIYGREFGYIVALVVTGVGKCGLESVRRKGVVDFGGGLVVFFVGIVIDVKDRDGGGVRGYFK